MPIQEWSDDTRGRLPATYHLHATRSEALACPRCDKDHLSRVTDVRVTSERSLASRR